ncbi:hypothetical protein CF319_g6607 [Tilletia indica]|nr:hypothetical protein CF319_g6607 [Tilletia indica]
MAQLKQRYEKDVPQQSVNEARLAIIGYNDSAQLAEFKRIESWLQADQQQDSDSHTAHGAVNGKSNRAFLCSSAAKAAWPHCKPFVAVDVTWTRTRYGMVLLLAATMDANSSMIILA